MLKAVLISFILATGAYAQDEDLNFLESSISTDASSSTESSTTVKKSRWSVSRPQAGNDKDQDKQGRVLDLRSVIEEGFRRNPLEQIRAQQREQLDLSKTDIFQKFWFPTVGLELQTSNHRIDRFHESSQDFPGMGAQKAPTGSLGVVFDEYTLFNWGRDYLQYLNDKQVLNRGTQQLTESHRRLKFSLIKLKIKLFSRSLLD